MVRDGLYHRRVHGVWQLAGRAGMGNAAVMSFEIENGIRPVCDALNFFPEVATTHSCEGHPEIPLRPYVSFRASAAFAFRLHRQLGLGHGDGSLKFCWWLVAHFDDDGSMVYVLEPNDIRIPGRRWFLFRMWGRKSMDRELKQLAALIDQLRD